MENLKDMKSWEMSCYCTDQRSDLVLFCLTWTDRPADFPLVFMTAVFIFFACFHVPAVSVCVWSVCVPPYRWDHAAGDQAPAGRRHHRAASSPVCLALRYVTRRRRRRRRHHHRPAAHTQRFQQRVYDALNETTLSSTDVRVTFKSSLSIVCCIKPGRACWNLLTFVFKLLKI